MFGKTLLVLVLKRHGDPLFGLSNLGVIPGMSLKIPCLHRPQLLMLCDSTARQV